MTSLDKPWLTSKPDSDLPEFLGLNLESFRGLATFCDLTEGFAIAFAEVNFTADGDLLIQSLQQRPECQGVQWVVLDFSQERLLSLLPRLMAELANLPPEANAKSVIVLRGLETSIGIAEDDVAFLEDLNFIRDALARRIPHPIVFILPKYALKRLARTARDFWAWASAVFEFRSLRESVDIVQRTVLPSNRLSASDLRPVKQSRIDQLHRLLEEYAPTESDHIIANAEIRLTILLELAKAYGSLAEFRVANQFFRQALSLAQASQQRNLEARALMGLGQTLQFTETYEQALEILEQALTIFREVGDRLGEANTLKVQGDVLQFLKQSLEALANYEQALTIFREVGARLGEADTLQAQGDVLQFLDQRSKALANYEQALTIFREVGDRLGEANTLLGAGSLQTEPQQAMSYFLRAQETFVTIGDRYSQGRTLLQFMIQAQIQLEDPQGILQSLDEAAAIGREIGFEPFCQAANQIRAQLNL
ncbi:tetratricopeptide repeat protein [Leptolyngbya sp. CCNP1308]|uniref:tetratricopeptide repeat protein n=1 Tax=Leptolyngbya sp. CCNP1308 TaxID=3110255 RepID=UPI002B1F6F60|nr:tetratricopeptide repeat protein [Leptolyngbya sp. CCNP1308]MEA5452894.1 tetratricopeptide repeat protein [Leptolyngbya sp. CCNP1308]